ncbi:hypothetical protein HPB47_002433 [Ixodes persulcatus]|uniref:Uncharacterized protein n=1 Tax=Ixodes persulcatus TaxID=34615 RepID=A0AC60PL80_IXOPE|nr:hypothetical protein HPB47_002433 [Ixodes persulcatus]
MSAQSTTEISSEKESGHGVFSELSAVFDRINSHGERYMTILLPGNFNFHINWNSADLAPTNETEAKCLDWMHRPFEPAVEQKGDDGDWATDLAGRPNDEAASPRGPRGPRSWHAWRLCKSSTEGTCDIYAARTVGSDSPYNHDRSKLAVANECDSGVTDDQRSSCGEEEGGGDDPYGLGSSRSHHKTPGSSEDADSAQGSLLLESSDSPSALDCVPLAEEPQQDGAAWRTQHLRQRSSVSVQCNGPDSLQKVLQAQSSMSLPEERRVNPPPAKTSSSKLAHLIQSFESVSVAPEVPIRRRYNANPRSSDPTPTENGRPTSPKQSRITPSLPPLASLSKTTTVRTTSSPPSGGGVASSRNVTLPVNVPLQRANATMLSASLPVTFATGATTSVTRVSFATNDAGTNLVTPKTNSVPDVNGVSNGGSNAVLAGRDALCSAEAVEEERMPRSSTLFWDPTELLKELYSVEPPQLHGRDLGGVEYVNKEGYLDMMPSNRKKATYWNPWKRRYFRLCDGNLSCFESENSQRPFVKAQLMGGNIDTLENNMIGIDDRKGHYIAVKCSSERDAEAWLDALHSQCQDNFAKSFVQPVLRPLASHKRVIVVDMGGCSIRAGILMDQPTMPTVYFPSVCSTDKNTGQQTFGIEALTPEVRKTSHLTFPLVPSAKISKFTMDVEALPALMRKIFRDLGITNPSQYKVQVCVPRSFSLQTQVALARALLEGLGVGGLSVTHQAICALYAYNTTSGIVVDLGDRLDIVPITDGYIVEGGVTRLPYGAHKLAHHLRQALVQKRVSLFSDVDLYLVRYVQQQACYVAGNYAQELRRFHFDPDSVEKSVPIGRFFQQDCPAESVSVDVGRFQAPEGLFQPELWGLDSGGVHKLVQRALQECSMDIRREMARSIYLSGGLTLLPGFAERLQAELDILTPDTVTPKVHASPYREHMAFLGASTMASTSAFDGVCVTLREWQQQGPACLAKWHL